MNDEFGKDPELVNPNEFPAWIIFEDENFLVMNKPGWLVCHPSKNGPYSSLVGAAREYSGLETMHLVSRLDRETSGVVVFAKNHKTASAAQKAIDKKLVGKKYVAIMRGELRGRYHINQPLAEDKKSQVFIKQTCATDRSSAKTAETLFTPKSRSYSPETITLAEVEIITGRKHQIRAHAQWINHELVGEKIYGPDENIYLRFIEHGLNPEDQQKILMRRQALHAREMDFSKVFPGMIFKAKLPKDFTDFMQKYNLPLPQEFAD